MTIRNRNEVKRIYPDIVVCNSRQVIAVVELKYLPRTVPRYKKDIDNLDFIAKHRSAISISNQRFRGHKTDDRDYELSKQILFVWAGVHAAHRDGDGHLFAEGYNQLKDCYLQLHAATHVNQDSDVYYFEY
jgi:hypothetical protein